MLRYEYAVIYAFSLSLPPTFAFVFLFFFFNVTRLVVSRFRVFLVTNIYIYIRYIYCHTRVERKLFYIGGRELVYFVK